MARKKNLLTESPVLIVDDNQQFSGLLKRMLQAAMGYREVSTVDSIEGAYKLIKENPQHFRMLFVDFNFPDGQTGAGLLERLKSEALLNDKTTFLITADPTSENHKQALALGAIGVVAKPFDRNELQRQLKKAERAIETEEEVEDF